jgi:hypothetical protein
MESMVLFSLLEEGFLVRMHKPYKDVNYRTIIFILILLISSTVSHLLPKTASSQLIPGTNSETTAGSSATTPPVKPRQLFDGTSLKIFSVWNFNNENVWEPLDNYTSNGYELKAVVPFKERYVVIFEKSVLN